uniref:Protein phosphatase 1 regulatory subunit 3A n=1 Tax=Pogona vitticeps TaxID=103695 RepID=A0A6J0TEA7_9SAUR
MESFEEPGLISRENLLEVPTLSDSPSEEEDVKATLQPRFSPSPRRRNSDSSEEMELEAPSTVTRKVSFADAFGFDLVSVKEFHSWDVPNTSPNDDLEDEVVAVEEFYLTPLFTLPATEEELLQKVRAQKLWLESVEFLPGITCMKGTIRVLNVSFQKLVYVRMSLDSWLTYYDILGEYVPNSCDGETDQFLFKITLVPPYQRDGTKVEFCIRYETSVGIFWANNDNQNYILICHKKETKQPETSLEPKQAQEEIADKHLKGCLKATPNSKEEILATADEDIWNDFRTSESDVPKILYSYVDDNEIERNKEKAKSTKVKHPEDDNENEKELELLLGQHFTSTAGCSRDERSLDTTEPVRFQNEPQEFGDKVDSGLLRQPLPISSSSEHVLQNKELHSKEIYSAGDEYSQSSPEKLPAIDSANITAVPSECFTPSESILSPEYQFGAKQNEAAKNEEVFLTKHGTCPADVQKDESRSPPGSKTIEELFISADDYDHHETVWEARPKGVRLDQSEGIQLRGEVSEVLNDKAKPFQEQQMKEISSQILSSSSESTAKNEPEREMSEHKNKEYFRGEVNTNNIAYDNVTIHCLRSSDAEDEIVEGKYKTEFNVDKSKEIKLSILEQSPEEEQVYSTVGHGKHCTQDSNEMTRTGKSLQGEVTKTGVLGEAKDKNIYESLERLHQNDKGSAGKSNKQQESTCSLPGKLSQDLKRTQSRYLEDSQNTSRYCISCPDFGMPADEHVSTHSASINLEDVNDTSGNLGKGKYSQRDEPENILEAEPCQSTLDRITVGDQRSQVRWGNKSWSDLESRQTDGESEANKRVQMKEGTGGEAMWGIRESTQCLNVTPTDELFTCQDPVRCEETSVAKHDSTGETEAVTAAYIIKATSEHTPEKMSAGEKAVIVKLPQETALSDRPTEERETVLDIHEGGNDGSHYPLCQCNTVGVLYDTKFEKEPVSDICNAHIHEMVHGEMISMCSTSEAHTRADHNTGCDSPSAETLWNSSAEGKAIPDQDLYLETALKSSREFPQSLYNEAAEEGSMWEKFHHGSAKTENKVPPADINIAGSCYESPSVTSSEESVEAHTAEGGEIMPPYTYASVEMMAGSGCDSNETNEMSHTIIPNLPLEGQLSSSEHGERSIGQFSHQLELNEGKLLGPTIVISEPAEEKEETRSETEGLGIEIKQNIEGHENLAVSDPGEPPGQQSEPLSLSSEYLVLKHIGYKILYFLLFVVFCVTLYHYDLIVCFALYLFSLYWLYCEGRKSKEPVKKD